MKNCAESVPIYKLFELNTESEASNSELCFPVVYVLYLMDFPVVYVHCLAIDCCNPWLQLLLNTSLPILPTW